MQWYVSSDIVIFKFRLEQKGGVAFFNLLPAPHTLNWCIMKEQAQNVCIAVWDLNKVLKVIEKAHEQSLCQSLEQSIEQSLEHSLEQSLEQALEQSLLQSLE